MFILIIILFIISRFLFDNFVILKNKIINCEKQVDDCKEKILKETEKTNDENNDEMNDELNNEINENKTTIQDNLQEKTEISKLETIKEELDDEMEKYDSFDF